MSDEQKNRELQKTKQAIDESTKTTLKNAQRAEKAHDDFNAALTEAKKQSESLQAAKNKNQPLPTFRPPRHH